MPDPKFTKPWHGVPCEQIHWHPEVIEDACIGCGTCVTGCSRLVYRFDYDRKKAVVVDPLNCMVGCTTCANTCPAHAIVFPPLQSVFALEGRTEVRHAVEDDLIARRGSLAWTDALPHPDRVVELIVAEISRPNPTTLIARLTPSQPSDCFCQFTPGQYVEIWIPGTSYLSRAYSIGNAPRDDGSIDLQIRQIEGGRLSDWAFNRMHTGEHVRVRGPLGSFTMRSPLDRALLFVAGGTGFAPIQALVEQQLTLAAHRDIVLVWGVADAHNFYGLDRLAIWHQTNPNLRIVLAAERGLDAFDVPAGVFLVSGTVADALREPTLVLGDRDAYLAGPPPMLAAAAGVLRGVGIRAENMYADAFGL